MAQDAKLNYKHYPRSVSWQVASVLNPSLQNSAPASQHSKHARGRRERSDAATGDQGLHSSSGTSAWKPWQEEESLPLPPQYVCPGVLCKAMPKYMRVKARPDQLLHTKPTAVTMTTSNTTSWSPRNHNHLPFSPHYDLAIGSPRSDHSSAKLTPRSVLESPKQATVVCEAANQQQAVKLASGAARGPASPARSPGQQQPGAPVDAAAARAAFGTTTPSVSAPHQNTPRTQATSGSRSSLPHSPSTLRRHSGAQGPRIRSAATSPMHPCAAATAAGLSPDQAMDSTSLQMKLSSTIELHPELLHRAMVPQMQSAAQGSPLSPASSSVGRETCTSHCHNHHHGHAQGHAHGHGSGHGHAYYSSPPVTLPPTPPSGERQHPQRKARHPPAQEPTLETYRKISPNTYATNTVWNDRRDQDSRDRDQTQPRRSILIKSN